MDGCTLGDRNLCSLAPHWGIEIYVPHRLGIEERKKYVKYVFLCIVLSFGIIDRDWFLKSVCKG